ncbi:MAG: ABC transporter permease [Lachnospiraceae bacterium]|nr:ABC transporter permease [Lachnospiraceae bacterium]
MTRFITYIYIDLKRMLKIMPGFILGIIGLIGVLIGWVYFYTGFMEDASTFDTLKIGLVVEDGDTSDISKYIMILKSMKSVNDVCDFAYVDDEKAKNGLIDGSLRAAVYLRSDTYDDINNGRNTTLNILLPDDVDQNDIVFKELIRDGLSLIRTTEASTYSAIDAYHMYEAKLTLRRIEKMIYDKYITDMLYRGEYFEDAPLLDVPEISFYLYYTACAFVLIILLLFISAEIFLRANDKNLYPYLKTQKRSILSISIARIIALALMGLLLGALICSIMIGVNHFTDMPLLPVTLCRYLLSFPLMFSLSAFVYMMFELMGRFKGSDIILLLFTIFMVLISGVLIPSGMLPEPLVVFGKCLPIRPWIDYVCGVVFRGESNTGVIYTVISIPLFYLIGVVRTWRDTEHGF